jgi:hypothetical protein
VGTACGIKWCGFEYILEGDNLIIKKDGTVVATFVMAPVIEGHQSKLTGWVSSGQDRYCAGIDAGGSVHIAIEHGHVCYWMETEVSQFENLVYFPEVTFKGSRWQTYMSDEHDRLWDKNLDCEVLISSAYADIQNVDGADGHGMTDPGDFPPTFIWNIPVRALSFRTAGGWLGLSIPGPLPVGVTRLKMCDRKLSITFQVLRPSCPEGMMPRVYFVTGLSDAYALLDEHRIISGRLGLLVKRHADHPAWWTDPIYCYWDAIHVDVEHSENPGTAPSRDMKKNPLNNFNIKTVLEWLEYTRKSTRVSGITCRLEQYCYNCYGDYRPAPGFARTEELRNVVDEMRKHGVRFSHYIHPYLVNTKTDFYEEHPEAFCKPKDKSFKVKYGLERGKDKPEFALLDWTHPDGREYILSQVEFLLSDKPGCLNVDILRSNHWRSPDTRVYNFHDPDWGIGDLMTMKVQRLIYEKAKQIKPHCAVSKVGFADCYMQPWADISFLCEEWNGQTAAWYRRGQIGTRTIPDVIFTTDAWFVTLTKGYEYYMSMLVWNIPMTNAYKHAIHPYMYYRELKEKDYRRRRAGFQVYLNAPINITDHCRVNWNGTGEPEIWRKRTGGPLAGWYAALALSKRCFVTYSEKQALVAASETRFARVPLPPSARFVQVTKVPHEGEPCQWPARVVETGEGTFVEMRIEDCGQDAMYYKIEYELLREARI